jgi:ubiquinone biosynthesis protein UbiJ
VILPGSVCDVLTGAIEAWLALDPDARGRLRPLAGRQVEIEITGLDLTFCIAPLESGLRILPRCIGEPDARISGPPVALFRAGAVGEDSAAAVGRGELTISGNVEVARGLEALLRAIDIDWEELLARRVGDVPAHQVGNAARRLRGWGGRVGSSLRADVSDYLREESGLLPTRIEIDAFMDEVDALRSDADRLGARVERIVTGRRGRTEDRGH